jgi:hypothetical protein
VTVHTGQGWAVILDETYTTPDRHELARRAAKREADAREARRKSLAETEEKERRAVAVNHGEGAAQKSYYESGGRDAIQWVVTGVPIPDDEPDPFEDLS